MEKDTIDRREEPDLNLAVFFRNAYNHPAFSDEKIAVRGDVEKGQEYGKDIEEDEKATLHDSLAGIDSEFVEVDMNSKESVQDTSPLPLKWGAFGQATKLHANQDTSLPDLGEGDSASLRKRSGRKSGASLSSKGENVEGLKKDTSTSGKLPTSGDDSGNELARVRSLQRYLQGQLSRDNSFAEPSSALNSEIIMESDAEKALVRDLQRYLAGQLSRENSFSGEHIEDDIDDEALRVAYLQGYLRGQLSREHSSLESSPLILKMKTSHKDDNEKVGDQLTLSPFTFKRGVLYESGVVEGDEIISASYLQGYVKGQLSRDNSGFESGSPLTFRREASCSNENDEGKGGASPSSAHSPGSPPILEQEGSVRVVVRRN